MRSRRPRPAEISAVGERFANAAGLAFIILGAVMIMIAAARLLFTARQIDSKDMHPGTGTRLDIALALLLALLWREPMPISIPRCRHCVLARFTSEI